MIRPQMRASMGSHPVTVHAGGVTPGDDHTTWWYPNRAGFERILRKLRRVRVVAPSLGVSWQGGEYSHRPPHAC